jgi:hypothetical protein
LIRKFVEHVGGSAEGAEARDLAEKFGLIFAGGMMGIKLGCVPWTDADVLMAVATCYRRARNLLTDNRQLLKFGLGMVRNALGQLPLHAPKQTSQVRFERINGYQERLAGTKSCVIEADAFHRLLPDDRQRNLVQQWLLKHRAIAIAQMRAGSRSSGPRPANQFTWPDGKRRRSLKIDWRLLVGAQAAASPRSKQVKVSSQ